MLGMNGGVGGAGGSGGSLADAAIPETGGAGGAGGAGGMGGMGGSDVADAETPIEVPVEDSGPPAAGAFGAACQEASECDSALCLDEGVCSKPCTDTSECGNGWACSLVTGLGDYCDLTCEHADVLFVVDGSGSMCETFGDTTRWQAVRNALIDPVSGVIPARAGSTAFGLLVFEGTIDPLLATSPPVDAPPGPACSGMYTEQSFEGECPGLVEVPVALNNVVPIDAAYPATELGGSTPTDKAMNVAVDRMLARAAVEPAREQFIVLLTDGRPNDICVGGAGGDGLAQHQALAAAVDRGADAGITTFVINLGAGDTVLETRLDEIAVRGQKDNLASAPTPLYEESLVEVLSTTMSQVGCGGD